MGLPSNTGYPPLSNSHRRSNNLYTSLEGWWMFTTISLPFKVCSFSKLITFSVSADERPDVGSSRNSTAGSRISSRAMFSRLRCPPDMYLLMADPTFRSFVASSPRSFSVFITRLSSSSSLMPSKQNLAVNQRF